MFSRDMCCINSSLNSKQGLCVWALQGFFFCRKPLAAIEKMEGICFIVHFCFPLTRRLGFMWHFAGSNQSISCELAQSSYLRLRDRGLIAGERRPSSSVMLSELKCLVRKCSSSGVGWKGSWCSFSWDEQEDCERRSTNGA